MTDPRAATARRKFGPHRQGHPGLVYQKIRSIFCPTTRWVRGDESAPTRVLDFGCGFGEAKEYLEAEGFAWTGYDLRPDRFGGQNPELVTDWTGGKYHIVALSDVLNVQHNLKELGDTVTAAAMQVCIGGELLWNYPANPRKMPQYSWRDMLELVERILAGRLEYEEIYDRSTVAWMGRVK